MVGLFNNYGGAGPLTMMTQHSYSIAPPSKGCSITIMALTLVGPRSLRNHMDVSLWYITEHARKNMCAVACKTLQQLVSAIGENKDYVALDLCLVGPCIVVSI